MYDLDTPLTPREKMRRPRHAKPTPKQIKAIQYIQEGMNKRQAMLKAGYSPKASMQPSRVLYKAAGTNTLLQSMSQELDNVGLTSKYMVGKFKEWLEAQKIHTSHTEPDMEVPDYETQIKAYDRWEKIRAKEGSKEGQLKRKITIEEFLNSSEPKQVSETIQGEVVEDQTNSTP